MPKNLSKVSPPLPPLPKHSPWLRAGQSLGVVALSANLVACEIDDESSLMAMDAGEETIDAELSSPMPSPEAGVEYRLMAGTDGGEEAGIEAGDEAGIQNDMEVIAPMPPPEMDMEVLPPMPPPQAGNEFEFAGEEMREEDMGALPPMPPPPMPPPMPPPPPPEE